MPAYHSTYHQTIASTAWSCFFVRPGAKRRLPPKIRRMLQADMPVAWRGPDASQPGKLTLYTSMKLPRVPNKVSAALQSMSGSCRPVPSRCKLRTVFHPSHTAERHGDLFAVAPLTKIVLAGMKTPLTRPRVRRCRHGEGTRHRMRT